MKRHAQPPSVSIVPVADSLGAAVTGIDLSRQLSDFAVASIREAWNKYLVLVFPGQEVGPEAQVQFCGALGELRQIRPVANRIADQPYVRYVSNVRDPAIKAVHESGELLFHADQSYLEVPCIATTLYAMEIPQSGGNTLFANCYDAYSTLSVELKATIAERKALNILDYAAIPTLQGNSSNSSAPQWWHPMVQTHPETGRKSLFVNRMMTRAIEGLGESEGNVLLQHLFEHQEQACFMYEHAWTPGDFLLWDNRCTLHARREFDPRERRMLRRVTIHARPAQVTNRPSETLSHSE